MPPAAASVAVSGGGPAASSTLVLGSKAIRPHAARAIIRVGNDRSTQLIVPRIGTTGIRVGYKNASSYAVTDATATQHVHVANNVIAGGGRYLAGGMGIIVGEAHDNLIEHNEIYDFYQSAISVGYTFASQPKKTTGQIATYPPTLAHDNIIKNNLIHDIGRGVSDDLGGIYLLTGASTGNVVTGNVIHDVVNSPDSVGYGANGLYYDQGTSNVLSHYNLVYRIADAVMQQNAGRANTFTNTSSRSAGRASITTSSTSRRRSCGRRSATTSCSTIAARSSMRAGTARLAPTAAARSISTTRTSTTPPRRRCSRSSRRPLPTRSPRSKRASPKSWNRRSPSYVRESHVRPRRLHAVDELASARRRLLAVHDRCRGTHVWELPTAVWINKPIADQSDQIEIDSRN